MSFSRRTVSLQNWEVRQRVWVWARAVWASGPDVSGLASSPAAAACTEPIGFQEVLWEPRGESSFHFAKLQLGAPGAVREPQFLRKGPFSQRVWVLPRNGRKWGCNLCFYPLHFEWACWAFQAGSVTAVIKSICVYDLNANLDYGVPWRAEGQYSSVCVEHMFVFGQSLLCCCDICVFVCWFV